MKKICMFAFLAVMVTAVAAPLFAQDITEPEIWTAQTPRRAAITLNTVPMVIGSLLGGFGIGTSFEYAFSSNASIRGGIYYVGFNIGVSGNDYRFSLGRFNLDMRWYPSHRYVRGFFLSGGAQFHRIAGGAESFNSVGVVTGLGHKAAFGGQNRTLFFIEPSVDIVWSVYSQLLPDDPLAAGFLGTLLGIRGPRFNLAFGLAF